jgi:hypothetical protein
MKKLVSKKLGLRTESIRILDSNTLPNVVGGGAGSIGRCAISTTCPPKDEVIGGVIPVY